MGCSSACGSDESKCRAIEKAEHSGLSWAGNSKDIYSYNRLCEAPGIPPFVTQPKDDPWGPRDLPQHDDWDASRARRMWDMEM